MLRILLNATITSKLTGILLLVFALFLGVLLLEYLPTFEEELLNDRKDSLRHMLDVAESLLEEYQQRAEQGEFSLEEAQSRAIRRIKNFRYGNLDYFWINDDTLPIPRMIMHPIITDLNGRILDDDRFHQASEMQFGVGGRVEKIASGDKNLFQAFVEVVNESGEGYVTYAWPKPTAEGATAELFPKESYVKLFTPWGWVIGTGMYIDDIQLRLSALRWSILSATGIILAVAMIILASLIATFITRPMNALVRYAEAVSAGDLNAGPVGRFYGETDRLKSAITKMVEDLKAAIVQADTKQREALQEAEKTRLLSEKLDTLFASMAEIVVFHELVFDDSGKPINYRITDCNQAFLQVVGAEKKQIAGELATEIFQTPEAPFLEAFSRVAMDGEPVSFESYFAPWDRHYIISVLSPEKNEFVVIATDITGRKRLENENQALANVIKCSQDFIGVAGIGQDALFVNPAGQTMVGLDGDEAAKRTKINEYFFDEDWPFVEETILPTLFAEGRWIGEFRFRHFKTGAPIPVLYDLFLTENPATGQLTNITTISRDISERIEMEAALKHSAATYREIFNAVNDAIYIHDIDTGAILDVNNTMLEMFGYTREEVNGLTVGDISSGEPPYHQERAIELLSKAAAGEPQVFEWHCRHKDGHLFWAEVSLKRATIAGQDRILAIERDISDRKRTEEDLLRTQFAMDRARDNIIWVDEEARIVYANDSACASMEYTRDELLSMTVFKIDPDFPIEKWEQHKKEMSQLGSMTFESRHITKSGRIFPVEVSSNYFEFNHRWMACAFDRDISERKRIEQALQEREKRYRLLVQNSNDIIQIMDVHGVPSYISDQIYPILGYRPEERTGIPSFPDIHPDDSERVLEIIERQMENPGAVEKVEYRYRHKNGEWVNLEAVSCNLLQDADIQGIFLNIRDISARKEAEQTIAKKNKELEQLVYVASHDLRSPLVNVDGYGRELEYAMEEIRRAYEGGASSGADLDQVLRQALPDIADALHHIRNGTRQMDALLKGLLTLSRSGRASLRLRLLDMNVLMAGVVSAIEFQIMETGARINIADLPPCQGDEVQVTQIFSNLIGNALKFLHAGRPGIITVSGHIDSIESVYCVEDNGIGIAPEHQANIFELFHRLNPSTTQGEGLGLTIVQQILGRLGGRIWVESKPDSGSRFFVALPSIRQIEE